MSKGQVEIFVSDNGLLKFRSDVSYPPISMQILETIQIKLFWFWHKTLKMSTHDLILECVNIWLLTVKFKQRNPAQVKIIFSDPEQTSDFLKNSYQSVSKVCSKENRHFYHSSLESHDLQDWFGELRLFAPVNPS